MDRSATVPAASGTMITESARETRALGAALGALAVPGTLVALVGSLGAGKTQLAKGVADGLNMRNQVAPRPVGVLQGLTASVNNAAIVPHFAWGIPRWSRAPSRCRSCSASRAPRRPRCSSSRTSSSGLIGQPTVLNLISFGDVGSGLSSSPSPMPLGASPPAATT